MKCTCLVLYLISSALCRPSPFCPYQKWEKKTMLVRIHPGGMQTLKHVSSPCFGSTLSVSFKNVPETVPPPKKKGKNHPILISLRPFIFLLLFKPTYLHAKERLSLSFSQRTPTAEDRAEHFPKALNVQMLTPKEGAPTRRWQSNSISRTHQLDAELRSQGMEEWQSHDCATSHFRKLIFRCLLSPSLSPEGRTSHAPQVTLWRGFFCCL